MHPASAVACGPDVYMDPEGKSDGFADEQAPMMETTLAQGLGEAPPPL